MDKTNWESGPWQHEPDRVAWTTRAGLPALLVRQEKWGNWIGYVAVPPGHPLHGKHYREVDARVHGGVTYAAPCGECICHVPAVGDAEGAWWFGFDAGHAFDQKPGFDAEMRALIGSRPSLEMETYRDEAYMLDQCEDLAAQLAEPVAPARTTHVSAATLRRLDAWKRAR